MPTLLYIHGFLSSPLSYKAQQLESWMAEHRPDVRYCCPQLTPYPDQCAAQLVRIVEQEQKQGHPVYLMGSSMGGFWATFLAERYNLPAVLINPAVDAMGLMPAYIHQTLQNYHSDETYYLKEDDLLQLARYDTPIIQRFSNYWLLAQSGDETLDYRLAVNKYKQCQQTIEDGGDHSFQHFERFHEDALVFLETNYTDKQSLMV